MSSRKRPTISIENKDHIEDEPDRKVCKHSTPLSDPNRGFLERSKDTSRVSRVNSNNDLEHVASMSNSIIIDCNRNHLITGSISSLDSNIQDFGDCFARNTLTDTVNNAMNSFTRHGIIQKATGTDNAQEEWNIQALARNYHILNTHEQQAEQRRIALEKTILLQSQCSYLSLIQSLLNKDIACRSSNLFLTPSTFYSETCNSGGMFVPNENESLHPFPLGVHHGEIISTNDLSGEASIAHTKSNTENVHQYNLGIRSVLAKSNSNVNEAESRYPNLVLSHSGITHEDKWLTSNSIGEETGINQQAPFGVNGTSDEVQASDSLVLASVKPYQELYSMSLSQKIDHHGKNRLYMQYYDEINLSEYQCLIRKQIEYFEAGEDDVRCTIQGRNKPISIKQVGVRCCFCSNRVPQHRTRGSTYYPTTLQGLYQACQNLATIHLSKNCPLIPESLSKQIMTLRASKSSVGGGKSYWADSAKSKGVGESNGILFFKDEKSFHLS